MEIQFDAKSFADVASGLQSLVVSFGLIVGGAWTAIVFRILGQKRRAEMELKEIQARLVERSNIHIDMSARQIDDVDGMQAVSVEVTITNRGNRDTSILYKSEGCVRLSRIHMDGSLGDERTFAPLRGMGRVAVGVGFLAGEAATEVFCFACDPGAYLVTFTADVRECDESSVTRKPLDVETHEWGCARIVTVRKTGNCSTVSSIPSV